MKHLATAVAIVTLSQGSSLERQGNSSAVNSDRQRSQVPVAYARKQAWKPESYLCMPPINYSQTQPPGNPTVYNQYSVSIMKNTTFAALSESHEAYWSWQGTPRALTP